MHEKWYTFAPVGAVNHTFFWLTLYMCTIYHILYCVVYYVPAMYKIMLFPSTQIVHDPLHAPFSVDHGELLVELKLGLTGHQV